MLHNVQSSSVAADLASAFFRTRLLQVSVPNICPSNRNKQHRNEYRNKEIDAMTRLIKKEGKIKWESK